MRIEPDTLDRALNLWAQAWGREDKALAISTHIMSVIGHGTNRCHTQKK